MSRGSTPRPLAAVLALVALWGGEALALPQTLTLRSQAAVAAGAVTLQQVVLEEVPPAWSGLVVAAAPEPGEARRLERSTLRRILALTGTGIAPRLGGANACVLRRVERAAPADRIEAAILRQLEALPLPPAALAQRFRVEIPSRRWAEGERVVLAPDLSLPAVGKSSVRLKVEREGGTAAVLSVAVAREVLVPVLRLTRPLTSGRPLTPAEVVVDSLWVGRGDTWREVLHRPDSVAGMTARKGLARGSVLLARDLRATPVVRRGTTVRWVRHRGGLTVTVRARARSEGAIGDQVWIESPWNRRLVRVRVVGPGEVGDPPPPAEQARRSAAAPRDAETTPQRGADR